jgi:hypothetical protein
MDKRLFWRAALTQAVAVAIVAGVLIALPLDKDFFKDYGIVAGPLAWILCAVATALILKLPWSLAVFAAAAGGVAGTLVDIAGAKHWLALPIAVAVFGACCGSYEAARREMAEADAEPGKDEDRDRTTAPR